MLVLFYLYRLTRLNSGPRGLRSPTTTQPMTPGRGSIKVTKPLARRLLSPSGAGVKTSFTYTRDSKHPDFNVLYSSNHGSRWIVQFLPNKDVMRLSRAELMQLLLESYMLEDEQFVVAFVMSSYRHRNSKQDRTRMWATHKRSGSF